jgi:hypothetical protein
MPITPYFATPVDADDLEDGIAVSPAVTRLRGRQGHH